MKNVGHTVSLIVSCACGRVGWFLLLIMRRSAVLRKSYRRIPTDLKASDCTCRDVVVVVVLTTETCLHAQDVFEASDFSLSLIIFDSQPLRQITTSQTESKRVKELWVCCVTDESTKYTQEKKTQSDTLPSTSQPEL